RLAATTDVFVAPEVAVGASIPPDDEPLIRLFLPLRHTRLLSVDPRRRSSLPCWTISLRVGQGRAVSVIRSAVAEPPCSHPSITQCDAVRNSFWHSLGLRA